MHALITEVVAEQPLVSIVGSNPTLAHKFADSIKRTAGCEIFDYRSFNAETIKSAYKILLILAPNEVVPARITTLLRSHQEKLAIVLPIISSPDKLEPHSKSWTSYISSQRAHVLELNSVFVNARFFFCLNLLEHSPILEFMTPKRKGGLVLVYKSQITFLSLDNLAKSLANQLLKPARASVLFYGDEFDFEHLFNTSTAHQQFFEKKTSIPVSFSTPLPFSVAQAQQVKTHKPTLDSLVLDSFLNQEVYEDEKKDIPPPGLFQASVKKTTKSTSAFVQNVLEKTTGGLRKQEKTARIARKAKDEVRIVSRSKRKTLAFYLGVVVSGVALGLLALFAVYIYASQVFLKNLQTHAVVLGDSLVNKDQQSLIKLKRQVRFLEPQINLYTKIFEFDRVFLDQQRLSLAKIMIGALENTTDPFESLKKLTSSFFNSTIGVDDNQADLVALASLEMQNYYQQLSQLMSAVDGTELNIESQAQKHGLEKTTNVIDQKRKNTLLLQKINPHISSLIGIEDRKTYLLLFQNSQELRPTGGFIQAVGLLNISDGKLVSFDVYSVYEVDSKLVGSAIPPAEIQAHLGESQWFFRDSNWDPHAPASAKNIEWFVNNALGAQIDGVIGLSSFGLKNLLDSLGNISIPEINEVINSTNLLERLEFYSDTNPNQSSVDFSRLLLGHVLSELTSLDPDKIGAVFGSINKSLSESQMFVAMTENSEASSVLSELFWDGGVITPNCPTALLTVVSECQTDMVFEVEANVGVNKANQYIKKKINHNITIQNELARHERISSYSNLSKIRAWPKGDYRSFVRYYLPQKAGNIAVFINNVQLSSDKISLSVERDRLVVGVYFEVPISTDAQIKLTYSTPVRDEVGAYVFFDQKQVGSDRNILNLSINLPPNKTPILIAPRANVVNNSKTVVFEHLDNTNGLFGVAFE